MWWRSLRERDVWLSVVGAAVGGGDSFRFAAGVGVADGDVFACVAVAFVPDLEPVPVRVVVDLEPAEFGVVHQVLLCPSVALHLYAPIG